ncbi:MAG: site-specific DNA-methyltransferase [Candidatus Marinimicrobia bacterium]|nr:site-specific DNA-methyltransferase [Candidatus Neomarinimicrobiota bacterium]
MKEAAMRYEFYNQDCILGAKEHLEDDSVDLIITDPPFAIEGDKLHKHYNRKETFVIDGYVEIAREEYADFSKLWITEAERVLRPGGALAVVSGYSNLIDILNALRGTTLKEINHIIWKYNFGVSTKSKFVSSHYHILYYFKPGGQRTFNTFARFGSRERNGNNRSLLYQDLEDVWIINREYKPGEIKNKNELPSALLIKLIQYLSKPRDVICDFFLGGFSTAKIAKGLGRSAIGFEINKISFDHHYKEVETIRVNEIAGDVKVGTDDTPLKAGEPWREGELNQLKDRYLELYQQGRTKKESIQTLSSEFERGPWAIIKRLNSMKFRNKSDIPLQFYFSDDGA